MSAIFTCTSLTGFNKLAILGSSWALFSTHDHLENEVRDAEGRLSKVIRSQTLLLAMSRGSKAAWMILCTIWGSGILNEKTLMAISIAFYLK